MVYFSQDEATMAFIGGLLISISTSIHLLFKGRVTGMSGLLYNVVSLDKSTFSRSISLIAGMITATTILFQFFKFGPIFNDVRLFDSPQTMTSGLKTWEFCLAGFLVGLGTKLANGCTSGHGVCGLPRFSLRSFVAVMSFLVTGLVVATLRNTELTTGGELVPNTVVHFENVSRSVFLISFLTFAVIAFYNFTNMQKLIDVMISFLVGFVFAFGLTLSGMLRRTKIIGFLTLNSKWDPSLMFVLAAAVGLNLFTFNFIQSKFKKPLFNSAYELKANKVIDLKLIGGSVLFGLGWGLGGLCPGPAINLFALLTPQIGFYFFGCLVAGQVSASKIDILIQQNKQKSLIETAKNK